MLTVFLLCDRITAVKIDEIRSRLPFAEQRAERRRTRELRELAPARLLETQLRLYDLVQAVDRMPLHCLNSRLAQAVERARPCLEETS